MIVPSAIASARTGHCTMMAPRRIANQKNRTDSPAPITHPMTSVLRTLCAHPDRGTHPMTSVLRTLCAHPGWGTAAATPSAKYYVILTLSKVGQCTVSHSALMVLISNPRVCDPRFKLQNTNACRQRAEEEEKEMNDFSAYAYAPPLLPLQTARDF